MKTRSKTPLFLMELIIMLLVFSVSAAVCLQVFSGARKISEESRKLDAAVMQAQTIAVLDLIYLFTILFQRI